MEINLDFTTYSNSGTLEVIVQGKNLCQSVCKYKNCYQLVYEEQGGNNKIIIDTDIVTNTKHLEEIDWQLLKILNPQVSSVQWSIFKLLKDLVDDRTEEDYTIDQIKQILGE